MFEIRIEGVEELVAAGREGAEQLVRDVQQGAARSAQVATRQIKADAPRRTGELQGSVQPHLRTTRNGATGDITIGADHASYVKDGTPAHLIMSKNIGVGGRLMFEAGGETLFRRAVNHPGTKANDYVADGVQQGQQALDHAGHQAVAKYKARIEG